jgi:hypothetical protein
MPKGEGTEPLEISTSKEGQFLDKAHLAAEPAHFVKGKVLLSDGRPMPEGMRITLGANNIWDTQTVGLSGDGTFEIDNVPNGDYCISPSVRGYKTRGAATSNCDVPVKLAGEDTRGLVITLYPSEPRP